METFLIVLIATGIGIYHDTNKATRYALNMEDGSKTHIMLKNDNHYACPLYCQADHIHHAIVCDNDLEINQHQSVYHISRSAKDDLGLFCSYRKILSIHKWKAQTSREELPDVVSAAEDKK